MAIKTDFYISQFNPRIEIAVNPRLINIRNSGCIVNSVLHWETDINAWHVRYEAIRCATGFPGGSTPLGVFDTLGEAVEAACGSAGIKSTDHIHQKREAALQEIEKALSGLKQMKAVLGKQWDYSHFEQLLKTKTEEVESAQELP